jgi:hypothetical protein
VAGDAARGGADDAAAAMFSVENGCFLSVSFAFFWLARSSPADKPNTVTA